MFTFQAAEKRKEEESEFFSLRALPRNPTYYCTNHILLLFFWPGLGDWPQLARELGKCSLYSIWPFAQLKIREYVWYRGDVAETGCEGNLKTSSREKLQKEDTQAEVWREGTWPLEVHLPFSTVILTHLPTWGHRTSSSEFRSGMHQTSFPSFVPGMISEQFQRSSKCSGMKEENKEC